jgi:ABC-type transport system involved in cytochrome c biogenesis permease subunit
MDTKTTPATTTHKTIYHRLATFCLLAPFIGVAINLLMPAPRAEHPPQTRAEKLADATITAAVPVLGVIAGTISLFGIRRYGSSGILWKSVTGLLIFALMVLALIPPLLRAREAARQRYEQRYGHPPP